MKVESYAAGHWCAGDGRASTLVNSVNDEHIGDVQSLTSGFDAMLAHGRDVAGPALRKLTIHERAERIKALAKHLLDMKDEFYRISYMSGATKIDSWIDIEGGIGTLFSYSGIARRELNNDTFAVEGPAEQLSAEGTFMGRHILTSKEAFRFISMLSTSLSGACWRRLHRV